MWQGDGALVPIRRGDDLTGLAQFVQGAKVVAFDLDNTLARSKRPMSPEMSRRLSQLTRLCQVAVITGGSLELVRIQVLEVLDASAIRERLHIMPTSGTRYYRWADGRWACVYRMEMPDEDRTRAIVAIERRAREQGVWSERVWGRRIDDRGTQITFSALGQQAPAQAKERWDADNVKKDRLADALSQDLPDLVVRAAGATSVDISARGIDKGYAVRRLACFLNIDVHDVVFIGDRMDPDGNDYPAAHAGTRPILVTGPDQTLAVCDGLIEAFS
jgi:HAD superfamily hydrolase (TIGR01484 family)